MPSSCVTYASSIETGMSSLMCDVCKFYRDWHAKSHGTPGTLYDRHVQIFQIICTTSVPFYLSLTGSSETVSDK
jgi:hypothetical protein